MVNLRPAAAPEKIPISNANGAGSADGSDDDGDSETDAALAEDASVVAVAEA